MYTTQQIIENQDKFQDDILRFFIDEIKETKKELRGINSNNEFILKEKEKLLRKFKKTSTLESIKKYFFLSNKRDEKFYVWWDIKQQEALILTYGKK
jgi:23S rRNA maturation mini-RNase III